mmetsp:Transcript_30019/g.95927  ORF Transcript_30019/g.95927 Transcript_30019/m.95927 type:complete len:1113 (-) Transcript_30019:49-3387(-)|eukprot:CAMPEP_0118852958 /NCGR_PEP_ID=MMETSP1163-20130328/1735_1 /TAXON_ID=124430 /ORGANISM="Phaeomonas parva, Strain CCMP2877" /LENGTH=1112 /DNA_ID=CAMNT_0006785431 /DNA_START=105 /DNA_END=3443 /DNA_ORIENTATION=+
MSVSIKVAVRCRPFTIEDSLGVHLLQNGEEEGEINLLNSNYSTARFAFSWAWWSAFGWQRRCKSDEGIAESMPMITQPDCYEACGKKIKAELLDGNAVVLFAYGLSGSGKTFTVFGPDAIDSPDAWFKHSEPTDWWGIFPRLAYELFQEKEDGWKITMKYFQNVVDIVRDLMSPVGQENNYKKGMRKDADGFTDIEWCSSAVLNSWDDLRTKFMEANARKAISPTQFNHQSTRGHCILTLEIEKPHPDDPSSKQRGRVYVCDLAGTEPAGDIYYANYRTVTHPDGSVDHDLIGPHSDQRKTKELQDQGKKINLSLTEMAQFFMKMAEAIKAKKLKPGKTIPGCNSYFLCKYLKDTMLQARTYLFCAIRPEVTYHKYTFSTLGFAKNASVIKLQPKKATVAASPAERRLMAELEQMKLMVQSLTEQNKQLQVGSPTGEGGGGDEMAALQEMLRAKQEQLQNVLTGGEEGGGDAMLQRQQQEYAQRGIALTHFEKDTKLPYFINLDEDPYRDGRIMYILKQASTTFGAKGDISPLSLSVVRGHCVVEAEGMDFAAFEGAEEPPLASMDPQPTFTLVGGRGETFHNGKAIADGVRQELKPWDRVVMGGELLLFHAPGMEGEDVTDKPTAEDAIEEYQEGLRQLRLSGGGGVDEEERAKLEEARKAFEAQKAEFERQKQEMLAQGASSEEIKREEQKAKMIAALDKEIMDLMVRTKEAKDLVNRMSRSNLDFEVKLQKSDHPLGIDKVKVMVRKTEADGRTEDICIDTFEFTKGLATMGDEVRNLRTAIENDREYTVDESNDPINLMFGTTTEVAVATQFLDYFMYMLAPEEDDRHLDLRTPTAPFRTLGKLTVDWEPLAGPPDDEGNVPEGPPLNKDGEELIVQEAEDLIGQPWTYRVTIRQATGLPVIAEKSYCAFKFMNETYYTTTVEQSSSSPEYATGDAADYTAIIHIPCITQEHVDFLQQETGMEIHVFAAPVVNLPKQPISSTSALVRAAITGNEMPLIKDLSAEDAMTLQAEVIQLRKEKEALQRQVVELMTEVARLKGEPLPGEAVEEGKAEGAEEEAKAAEGADEAAAAPAEGGAAPEAGEDSKVVKELKEAQETDAELNEPAAAS